MTGPGGLSYYLALARSASPHYYTLHVATSYAHDRALERRLHIAASTALRDRLATHERRAALAPPPPARNARVGARNERSESLNCEPRIATMMAAASGDGGGVGSSGEMEEEDEGGGSGAEDEDAFADDPRHGAEIHIFIHAALLPRWPAVLGELLGAVTASGLGALASSVTVVALGDHSQVSDDVAPKDLVSERLPVTVTCGGAAQLDRPGADGFQGCCNASRFDAPGLARKLRVVRSHSGLEARAATWHHHHYRGTLHLLFIPIFYIYIYMHTY